MKKKVLVAMSGGVDSSVAVLLLQEQGFEVSGATLSLLPANMPKASAIIEDARRVADFLSIPHVVFDMRHEFEKKIIHNFLNEYSLGRTPNPCVLCNKEIKFGLLFHKFKELGFDFLSGGHYARKVQNQNQRWTLAPVEDSKKDQGYYLYRLSQEVLSSLLFPLGDYTKEEVRALAKKYNLPVAEKEESQDICFVQDNDYRAFLRMREFNFQRGFILNMRGDVLASHAGKENFTIGQRKGLGIAAANPLYVNAILPNGDIVVGEKEESKTQEFILEQPNFLGMPEVFFETPRMALVQIRYHSLFLPATVKIFYRDSQPCLHVYLKTAASGVTPGQSAVLYHHEQKTILAGGLISIQSPD